MAPIQFAFKRISPVRPEPVEEWNGPILIGIFTMKIDSSLMKLPNGRMTIGSGNCSSILVQTASHHVAAAPERKLASEPVVPWKNGKQEGAGLAGILLT